MRVNPTPTVVREFGARIRAERTRAGLSQIELGERSGLHFTFVSSIERGQRNPTLTTILHLAAGLDVEPSRLMKGLPARRKRPSS